MRLGVSLDEMTLDHVVAVSLDGEHRAANVRPAHARCNSRRGARPA
jgi:5-methylcytosine-specific restriction endonuclease McrA